MSKKQSIIAELLAVAGESIGTVDANNPADVEKYLFAIALASDKLSDEEFKALSPTAQNWFNAVAQLIINREKNLTDSTLADVAFSAGGLELSDLPTENAPVSRPVSQKDDGIGEGIGEAQKTPKSPDTPPPARRASKKTKKKATSSKKSAKTKKKAAVSKPSAGGKKVAFFKRNRWGNETKSKAVINSIIASNGETAHDLDALYKVAGDGASDILIKTSVAYALYAFDSMRQEGWLNLKNESVQSFIKSFETE